MACAIFKRYAKSGQQRRGTGRGGARELLQPERGALVDAANEEPETNPTLHKIIFDPRWKKIADASRILQREFPFAMKKVMRLNGLEKALFYEHNWMLRQTIKMLFYSCMFQCPQDLTYHRLILPINH